LNDLKDVILSTLEELENEEIVEENSKEDIDFLIKLRERLLVFFEGLQSPNLVDTEKKLDLTINYLEYTLAMLDKKINAK
jgi:hypothetical protein